MLSYKPIDVILLDNIIRKALEEDLGWGDITTDSTVSDNVQIEGNFIAKEDGIICGIEVCKRTFMLLDASIEFIEYKKDGDRVKKGDLIAFIKGSALSILKGERVCLNFFQRMSGIATFTDDFVKKVEGLPVKIVDTRKTVPGLRILDKYAVRIGGGFNHRYNLSDMVLIKDNHIKASGGIGVAISKAREAVTHTVKIEVEVESLSQLQEALDAGADIIMLDNMSPETMKEAVSIAKCKVLLEASGNVTLNNVREIAETGVDFISIGALTHSVKALDISLIFI